MSCLLENVDGAEDIDTSVVGGDSIERRTSICAAIWKMTVGRASAKSCASFGPSRTSATWSVAPLCRAWSRCERFPVTKLSMTVTSSPACHEGVDQI